MLGTGRLLVGIIVLTTISISPALRDVGIALEPVVPPVLFAVALVGGALAWVRRRKGGAAARRQRRRLETRVLRALGGWGWVGAVLLFLLPLWSTWAGRPPSGVSAWAALLGHLPWGDSLGHFEGANRLLAEGAFGPFSERRPINAAWLAVRLSVCGTLQTALVLQAILLGLAAYVLSRSVAIRLGLWPSLGTFALVLGFSTGSLPTAATEPLGITLSCLALALLFSQRAQERLPVMAAGLFLLDAALGARPGAQFLLPCVMAWAVFVWRRALVRVVLMVLLVAATGSLTTATLNALYGSGEGSFTSYPAYTLYGLTRNSNWRQARVDFGPEIEQLGRERDVARFLYGKAWDNLRRDPRDFFRGLGNNGVKFMRKLPANLSRIVSLRWVFVSAEHRVRSSREEVRADVLWGGPFLLAALLASVATVSRTLRGVDRSFWLAVFLGIVASVPFVYGDAGLRGLAASFPFIALGLSLGFGGSGRTPLLGAVPGKKGVGIPAAGLGLSLVVVSIGGPAVAHRLAPRPEPGSLIAALPGEALVVSLGRAPAVLVTQSPRSGLGDLPQKDRREFLQLLEWAALPDEDRAVLEGLRPPFVLLSCYDFVTKRQLVAIAPVELLHQRVGFLRLRVRALGNFVETLGWQAL